MAAEEKEYELQYLKGIGPRRAKALARYGIETFYELFHFFPRRYVDRSLILPLSQLQPEQEVTVVGKIEAAGIRRLRRQLFYIVISDETSIMEAVWFQGVQYFKNIFKVGEWVALSGKVTFYRGFQMTHPDYDLFGEGEIDNLLNSGKIIPFYPGTEAFKRSGLTSLTFRRIFQNLVRKELHRLEEILPAGLIACRQLIGRQEAFKNIHWPENSSLLEKAQARLKYDEFFQLQLMLALQKHHLKTQSVGIAFDKQSPRLERLYKTLPFQMTAAQKKVMHEIRKDMRKATPMNRLLQGDVGAGKTLVAIMAMLIAVDNGRQAALMVPTEILAEQHFLNIAKLLQPLGVQVSLLTGSTKTAQRKELAENLKSKQAHIVIGTHALIQDAVKFSNLGLVIIDEQHRFGVMQRSKLMHKDIKADLLVMTATPIPRTLALTVYGSLDVSLLDEMPPNRQRITTLWRFDNKAKEIYAYVKQRLQAGEQAYFVYPLVQESEKLDLKAATEGFEYLAAGPFKDFKVGLLHGRMKGAEKEELMQEFLANEIQLLVATTVIEVGVDVANATIMLIEHAERFGLSQLHQLRGRVGRGRKKSFCILKTPYNIGDIAQKRMRIMTETSDGFVIAEKDLELRGWGDFFGVKQSGMPDFKLANPITDREILEQARTDAFQLVKKDPFLRGTENLPVKAFYKKHLQKRMQMIKIS